MNVVTMVRDAFWQHAQIRRDTVPHLSDMMQFRCADLQVYWTRITPSHFTRTGNQGTSSLTLAFFGALPAFVEVGPAGAYSYTCTPLGHTQEHRLLTQDEVVEACDRAFAILAREVAARTLTDVAEHLRSKSAGFAALKKAVDLHRELCT